MEQEWHVRRCKRAASRRRRSTWGATLIIRSPSARRLDYGAGDRSCALLVGGKANPVAGNAASSSSTVGRRAPPRRRRFLLDAVWSAQAAPNWPTVRSASAALSDEDASTGGRRRRRSRTVWNESLPSDVDLVRSPFANSFLSQGRARIKPRGRGTTKKPKGKKMTRLQVASREAEASSIKKKKSKKAGVKVKVGMYQKSKLSGSPLFIQAPMMWVLGHGRRRPGTRLELVAIRGPRRDPRAERRDHHGRRALGVGVTRGGGVGCASCKTRGGHEGLESFSACRYSAACFA